MLLHNGGFCSGCITKRILLLQAFYSKENQNYADYEKKYREIVKLVHFMTLSLVMQTPFCDAAVAKSTVFVAAPTQQYESLH